MLRPSRLMFIVAAVVAVLAIVIARECAAGPPPKEARPGSEAALASFRLVLGTTDKFSSAKDLAERVNEATTVDFECVPASQVLSAFGKAYVLGFSRDDTIVILQRYTETTPPHLVDVMVQEPPPPSAQPRAPPPRPSNR